MTGLTVIPSDLENSSEQFEPITFDQFSRLKNWDSLHHVYKGMHISGCLCAKDSQLLLQTGIKHVINLADDIPYDPYYFHHDAINYYDFPTSEEPHEKEGIFKYLQQLLPLLKRIRKNKEKVLIHCYAGVNRSATLILTALMFLDSLPLPDALLILQTARPYIRPSALHLRLLCQLNKNLFKKEITPSQALLLLERFGPLE